MSQDVTTRLSEVQIALTRVFHGVPMSLRTALFASLLGTAGPLAEAAPLHRFDPPSIQDSDQLALDLLVRQTRDVLVHHGIPARVTSRVKTAESLHGKMQRKGLSWENVYDRLALRVVVEDQASCYRVLELIEAQHQVVRGERDDYIASPKANGYQSLHTVLRSADGTVVELQIRTHQMHAHAEWGGASHAAYKARSA